MYLRYESFSRRFSPGVGGWDSARSFPPGFLSHQDVPNIDMMKIFLLRQKEGIRICWMLL